MKKVECKGRKNVDLLCASKARPFAPTFSERLGAEGREKGWPFVMHSLETWENKGRPFVSRVKRSTFYVDCEKVDLLRRG